MACPLSLGDILAVAQICYTIGKQLTIGRLEAIQEFRGVESMLCALGASLTHLDNEVKRPGSIFARAETAQTAVNIVYDCSIKLQSLERIVRKYSGAMADSELSWKEWRQGLMDNCLRVMWTREEKELTNLSIDLTLRITTINNLILTTNSAALGNIDNKTTHILDGIGVLDGKTDDILNEIRGLRHSASVCSHACNEREKPTTTRIPSPIEKPAQAVSPEAHFLSWRTKHPGGLPYASEQRCRKIDAIFFELEISEESEAGTQVICPKAQLKGFHFLAAKQGRIREDLFQCNCKLGSRLRSVGTHTKQLKEYSCGPKTFLAQSHYQISTPLRGRCWWLLQTQTKTGGQKNLFLKLSGLEKRPQFAEIVASMLRTNVARNILSGTTLPFDLARRAKKISKNDTGDGRLHIAWTYDERRVNRSGTRVRIEKLPGKEHIEISNPMEDSKKRRFSYEDRIQDYFTKENSPNFSWYRVAMFESLNICSSIEDDDPEDAHFFLDHFHTSVEFKVELSHPTKDPGQVYWGVGEFGGVNAEIHKKYNQNVNKKEPTCNELRFSISGFTIVKGEDWNSPRPVNCSLCFTFPPWSLESQKTMRGIWEKYESLSTTTGRSATEFALARQSTQTKESPQVLMRVKNAIFEDISARDQDPELLKRHDFDPNQTFRDSWLLARKSENPKSPLRITLRSMRQDIYCNIYLSGKDALSLREPGNSIEETTFVELHQPPSQHVERSQSSWCWVYPRELYSIGTPSSINICGSLKLKFASESDLNGFSMGMKALLSALGLASEHKDPPPYVRLENHYSTDSEDALRRSKTLPSKSEPNHVLKERISSWSVGLTPPSPDPKATGLGLHVEPPILNKPGSMYVITQGKAWEPPAPPHYTLSEYQSCAEKQVQNWQRPNAPGTFVMPDAGHFVDHTLNLQASSPASENDSHGGQGWNKETNYSHDAQLQRAWTEPTKNNPKDISPSQSPLTTFPDTPHAHDNHSLQNTPRYTQDPVLYPPQLVQWQQDSNYHYNYNGLKRYTAISDYVGSSQNNQLSLRAGQTYNIVPQPDGSPWVWIDGNSCGPSGFAPKCNFQEYAQGF